MTFAIVLQKYFIIATYMQHCVACPQWTIKLVLRVIKCHLNNKNGKQYKHNYGGCINQSLNCNKLCNSEMAIAIGNHARINLTKSGAVKNAGKTRVKRAQ